jgi:hypothetical protein
MNNEETKNTTKNIINPDPFCPVRLTLIENRGRATDKYMVELQKPNSEEWEDIPGTKAVHSTNYRLVTNSEVHKLALDVMGKTDMEFKHVPTYGRGHSKSLVWDGKHYLERWYTPDVRVDTPHGSSVMLGMEVRNSYDGHDNVGLAFFGMHCACSNQFFSSRLFDEPFKFSHVGDHGELQDDIEGALATLNVKAGNFANIVPTLNMLMGTRLTSVEAFLNLRKKMVEQTGLEFRDKAIMDELSGVGITHDVGVNIGHAYGAPDSLWALANAFTAITTHAVGGLRGQQHATRAVDWLIEETREMNGLPRRLAA